VGAANGQEQEREAEITIDDIQRCLINVGRVEEAKRSIDN
jgi:hypothetical protein